MSFYLAHPADTTASHLVSQSVKDKGLLYYRAKPCDVAVTVLPLSVQPGYACYSLNLPAFMLATVTQKVTHIGNTGYPLGKVPYLLPFTLPALVYDFRQTPPPGQVSKFLTHSTMLQGKGKTKMFVMQSPTLEKIKTLVSENKDVNQKTAHIINTVNLEAMKSVFVIQKILSAFLLTHVYPAFLHDKDEPKVEDEDRMEFASKRRKVTKKAMEVDLTVGSDSKDDLSESETEAEEVESAVTHTYDKVLLTSAKPSTIVGEKWGPIGSIPNASGLYVPYVRELAVAETMTVPTLVSTTFVRSLATTSADMFEQLEKLRSAWGIISTTELGHEITHMCKCVEIALRAQATVYPVYNNGIYEGTVISGAKYRLNVKGVSMDPLCYQDLQKLVMENSAHSKAIREINSAIDDENIDVGECESMREISAIVRDVSVDEITKQSIIKSAYNLCFKQKYWSTTPTHIRKMLGYLLNPDKEVDSDVPLYPKYLFSTERVEVVLAAFGHQAPTFMIPGGSKCELKGSTPPKDFHVRTISVESAILDMKYVVENGYVSNNVQGLSSKHRDQSLNGEDKKEIWKNLVDYTRAYIPDGEKLTITIDTEGVGETAIDDLW